MRLAKFLAHAGVASRRGAEEIVRAGRVTIAGETVTDPARDVDVDSGVAVDGRYLEGPEERMVFVVNKPAGVLSTAADTHGRRTVVDLVPGGRARGCTPSAAWTPTAPASSSSRTTATSPSA